MRQAGQWLAAPLLSVILLVGCELAEVTTAEPEASLVAEVFLRLNDDGADGLALLHMAGGAGGPVTAADVRVRRAGGPWVPFQVVLTSNCNVAELPEGPNPRCLLLPAADAEALVVPGARLEVEVRWNEGSMAGATTVPGAFEVREPASAPGTCRLPPGRPLSLVWTRSTGAWAYVPEARLNGLGEALGDPESVHLKHLTLQGLSISEADTTVVFPTGFGLFDRFSDQSDAILAIRDGLPPGVSADVVVAALDRNAVNWLRGGAFNPSGLIRIPSLFGDGTGVVASLVNRSLGVVSGDARPGTADCQTL